MKKKILALLFALTAGFCFMYSGDVYAAAIKETPDVSCSQSFFGLRPWHYGLQTRDGGECKIGTPDTQDKSDADEAAQGVASFLWVIVLNVLGDLFVVGGLVAVGFIIYGGYFYIRSGGEPSYVAKGKKTILNAIIGLIVMVLASTISKWITDIIAGG